MIRKKTVVTLTYGSANNVRVRIQREENVTNRELFTTSIDIFDAGDLQRLGLSSKEARVLYDILGEAIKDGNI